MNARLAPALALFAVLSFAGWAATDEPLRLASGGTITIEGTSNIDSWHCATTAFTGTGNGVLATAGLTGLSALTVTVPVAQIDCRNGTMNTKLRQALRATTAPNIRFVLGRAATVGAPTNGRFTVTASGQLTMAGQTRPVTVTAQGQAAGGNRFRFTGSVPIVMSQYGIRPPTAIMGTLRVRDAVTVRFDVTLAR